ncbi:unnamed protein product [Pylaiella littoralis]
MMGIERKQLCLGLVLAFSLQPAVGLLSPHPFLSRPSLPAAASSSSVVVPRSSSSSSRGVQPHRLPLLGAASPRPRCPRPCCRLPATAAAASMTNTAAGFYPTRQPLVDGNVIRQHFYHRTRVASNTALAAGRPSSGGVRGGGQDEKDGGGGWRQRVVRSVVSVFLKFRAMVAALGARLGLNRRSKSKGDSTQSLFSSIGGKKAAALNKSRGAWGRSMLRLPTKKTALLLAVVMLAFAARFGSSHAPSLTEVPMSTFMQLMEGKRGADVVESVRVTRGGTMFFKMNGKECYTIPLRVSKEVFKALSTSGIPFMAVKSPPGLSSIFPVAYLFAVYFFVIKRGSGSMVGSTGKLASSTDIDTSLSFGDVAGVDQAKEQVQELVSMIKDPGPFIAAGARLPSGLLMVGPPGTGKTLMARVMASEAGVPFYYCSGSDFVEMFVGRGAARVRKLFAKAGKTAPCIIFLDELDALGKERSSGGGGRQSNDEAEQTLNQLLASMDGLDTNNNGVMVIAATNRYEVLDGALTRPGRFDRIVRVDVPDAAGREAILKVHTRKMKVDDLDVLKAVAELTPGLAGAELATIANEAAISAARRGSQQLLEADFLDSVTNFYVSRKKEVAGLQSMLKGILS